MRLRSMLVTYFTLLAAICLGVVGAAKVFASLGSTPFLDLFDPIFRIRFRQLILLVGLLEVAVAAICLVPRIRMVAVALVAWLSTSFLAYRLGLWLVDWRAPCKCLGSLTDALHLSPRSAELIATSILVFLFLGSYALLALHLRMVKANLTLAPK